MAPSATRRRSLGTWIVVAVLAAAAIVLGVVLVGGLGTADEAGRPLGVPAVSVTPGPIAAPAPTASPTGEPAVVDAPPPVTVDLDDHGGDNGNSGKGNSGNNDDD